MGKLAVNPEHTSRRAVFFSGAPKSVGHVYRVEQTVAALMGQDWRAAWFPVSDPTAYEEIRTADIVVVFRAGMDAHLREIRTRCSEHRIPLVYDIDDLIFDPELADSGKIALFDALGADDRLAWRHRIAAYRDALALADHATVSTEPLATAARRVCKSVHVLPNVLGPAMWERAAAAQKIQDDSSNGVVRLIFASGTPTHHRDFEVSSGAVARVLAKHAGVLFTLLGEFDLAKSTELSRVVHRIEKRPRVPFPDLFAELARADINLCPLEHDNAFCEAKSAVRCLGASAVGVPSIVSPTATLLEAVGNGRCGMVAHDSMAWEAALDRLIGDSRLRQEIGRKAHAHALKLSDFGKWGYWARGIYQKILSSSSA